MSESKTIPAPPPRPPPVSSPKNEASKGDEATQKIHIEETIDERLGGPNKCGRLWIEYWKSRGVSAQESLQYIPDVDVKFKVYRLSDFDGKAGTIYVETVLMLDWVDPSLELANKETGPDPYEHFWPMPGLENLAPGGDDGAEWESVAPKYKPDKENKNGWGVHRASITIKFRAVLYARLDFRKYPFDHQALEITVKMRSLRVPGVKKGTRPRTCHPTRWRSKEGGHELVTECDCLPEFTLVRLASKSYCSAYGPFPEDNELEDYANDLKKGKLYRDVYSLQIIMTRDSTSVLWNMCFSLFVIDVMIFSAHGIHISELADRLGISLSLLLTAMAFKWVLGDTLPSTPYLTTLEIYVVQTFAVLFFQGVAFWLLADAFNYRCGAEAGEDAVKMDWITGAVKDANGTDVIADISCETVHVLDRVVLFLEVFAFFAKNFWFLHHVVMNRQTEVAKQTHYINLGRLTEYQMPEKLCLVKHANDDEEEAEIARRIEARLSKEPEKLKTSAKIAP